MIDSYGRIINYLRVSITDNCNLRCKYCMPETGIENLPKKDALTIKETFEIIKVFADLGIDKIRITGGEPLVRDGVLSLIKYISNLEGIKDISMTTNGILLKKYARELKEYGLNRVNVSLDTLDKAKYKSITRGGNLDDVLEGIKEAQKVGLNPIKINTVLIGGFNDNEIDNFINLTILNDLDIRFIELMPIGQAKKWAIDRFVSNQDILRRIDNLKAIEREDKSSPAEYYKSNASKGRVGFINPISCKFCDNCNRLRLTSDGMLKFCLHSNEEIDLRTPLRNGEDLKKIILGCIDRKPKSHHLEEGKYSDKDMATIGG